MLRNITCCNYYLIAAIFTLQLRCSLTISAAIKLHYICAAALLVACGHLSKAFAAHIMQLFVLHYNCFTIGLRPIVYSNYIALHSSCNYNCLQLIFAAQILLCSNYNLLQLYCFAIAAQLLCSKCCFYYCTILLRNICCAVMLCFVGLRPYKQSLYLPAANTLQRNIIALGPAAL